jgi:hypothetical protein
MARSKAKSYTPGAPSSMVARVNHLKTLFKYLPESLPFNPTQSFCDINFDFNKDDLTSDGAYAAISQSLRNAFPAGKDGKLTISERGGRMMGLIPVLLLALKQMPDRDREMFRTVWIERLIDASKAAGARVPSKYMFSSSSVCFLIDVVGRGKRALRDTSFSSKKQKTTTTSHAVVGTSTMNEVIFMSPNDLCAEEPLNEDLYEVNSSSIMEAAC